MFYFVKLAIFYDIILYWKTIVTNKWGTFFWGYLSLFPNTCFWTLAYTFTLHLTSPYREVPESHSDHFFAYRSGDQEVDRYRGGFVVPLSSGKRVIILKIWGKDGFLDGSLKCFIVKKGSANFRDGMNAAHFEVWFREVLYKLWLKSIIVIDQAHYHTMLDPEWRILPPIAERTIICTGW